MTTLRPGPRTIAAIAAIVVLAAAGWAAFDRYFIYLPGLVQDLRDPIGPAGR